VEQSPKVATLAAGQGVESAATQRGSHCGTTSPTVPPCPLM